MKLWQVMAGVFIAGLFAFAQEAPQEQPGRESEDQTVSRCIRDLEHADVLVRRRAAMLLGKYSGERVEAALVRCLKDGDAAIRLGALVSLTEEKMLPAAATPEVFRLLADPDVHIRRMASSLVPMAWGTGTRIRMVRVNGNRLTRVQEQPGTAYSENVLAALDDGDTAVRRNILKACRQCAIQVPPEKLVRFLADTAMEVRILAIQLCRFVTMTPALTTALEKRTADPAAEVRRELCELCGDMGADGEKMLRRFLQDSDLGVRVQAVQWLVRQKAPDGAKMVAAVVADGNIAASQKLELMRILTVFQPDEAKGIYRQMLASPSNALVAAALQAFARSGFAEEPAAFFIPYLDSESAEVARAAVTGIQVHLKSLTPQDAAAIMASRNTAAKTMLLKIGLRFLKPQQAGQALADACMDCDAGIRVTALSMLPRYRPDGWQELLTASLEDEAIQAAAAEICMVWRRFPPIRAALQDYVTACKNPVLKAKIQQVLVQPTAPVRPAEQPQMYQKRTRP